MASQPTCRVDGCERKGRTRGMCSPHYLESLDQIKNQLDAPVCTVKDCLKRQVAKGYCKSHYSRFGRRDLPSCVWSECERQQYSQGHCRKHYDFLRNQELKRVVRPKCEVEGCIRHVRNGTTRLCPMHETRLRRFGEIGPPEPLTGIEGCSVAGCDGEHKAKGFCNLHYRRFLRNGDPLDVKRVSSWDGIECQIANCSEPVDSKGLCNRHYLRFRVHGDPLGGGPSRIRRHFEFCNVEGCQREYAGLGFCSLHLKRFRSTGDPLRTNERRKGLCSIESCGLSHLAKGFCSKHYGRWVTHGDPLYERSRPTECIVTDCHRSVMGNGYCQMHYTRVRKWGDPYYVQRISDYRGALCSIESCERKIKSKGWCELHYGRWATHGDPMFNFWEVDMEAPTDLYRLFSEHGELLYIGISIRVEQRLYEHSQSKWWWPEVEYQLITNLPTRREALELEEWAIRSERPKYNVTHNQVDPSEI